MPFSGRAHVIMLQLGKVNAPRPLEQPRHVFSQALLVAPECQDIVALGGHDLFSNRRLGTRGVNRHNEPFRSSSRNSSGMAVISLDLASVATWPKTSRLALA